MAAGTTGDSVFDRMSRSEAATPIPPTTGESRGSELYFRPRTEGVTNEDARQTDLSNLSNVCRQLDEDLSKNILAQIAQSIDALSTRVGTQVTRLEERFDAMETLNQQAQEPHGPTNNLEQEVSSIRTDVNKLLEAQSRARHKEPVPPQEPTRMINLCLLYTSPSPRDA